MDEGWIVPDLNDERTLPKDGERVLAVIENQDDGAVYMNILQAHWEFVKAYTGMLLKFYWVPQLKAIKVTHWKPLPPFPKKIERTE